MPRQFDPSRSTSLICHYVLRDVHLGQRADLQTTFAPIEKEWIFFSCRRRFEFVLIQSAATASKQQMTSSHYGIYRSRRVASSAWPCGASRTNDTDSAFAPLNGAAQCGCNPRSSRHSNAANLTRQLACKARLPIDRQFKFDDTRRRRTRIVINVLVTPTE